MKKYKVAIIGAGNGGQAMAGYLAMRGHQISLYNRSLGKISNIIKNGGVYLKGEIETFGLVSFVSDDLSKVVAGAEIIMITTTADANGEIAERLAPFLEEGQIIILNSGRTGGAFEVRKKFNDYGLDKKVYVVEAQTLVYACRQQIPGVVEIFGIKDRVFCASLPTKDLTVIIDKIRDLYGCFVPVDNVLVTSLENMGAILHPALALFNASLIERGDKFCFYNNMTPQVASFIEKLDEERLLIGEAYGLKLQPVKDWVSFAYDGVLGEDLLSRVNNNPAYFKLQSPASINSRFFTEDIPAGILPLLELGRIAGLKLPIMEAILVFSENLLGLNFREKGRTLENMGLAGLDVQDIIKLL
ncbi:MAG: NAD/NADP octopine/nopaline dehydrogenase family protein [Patescibacteria group bacterium]|jgi:opine dehydrogenase